jgi:uncharacterized protein YkwD
MLTKFDGYVLIREGEVDLRTHEGKAAVQEAIEYLS